MKNPFRLAGGEKIFFEEPEKRKKRAGFNSRSARMSNNMKRIFSAENAQNSPKKRKNTQKRSVCLRSFFVYPNGDLIGNRTRVYAVRGRRLNRLTIRPWLICLCSIAYFFFQGNCFCLREIKFFEKFFSVIESLKKSEKDL